MAETCRVGEKQNETKEFKQSISVLGHAPVPKLVFVLQ